MGISGHPDTWTFIFAGIELPALSFWRSKQLLNADKTAVYLWGGFFFVGMFIYE